MKSFASRCLLFLLLVLLCVPTLAVAEDEPAATDLTGFLQLVQTGGHGKAREKLIQKSLNESETYAAYELISLAWPAAAERPETLCIQWGTLPESVRILEVRADGTVLSDTAAESLYDAVIPLSPETDHVTLIAGEKGMSIARLRLYGAGTLPAPFYDWQDTPHGLDYLIVATHPDDDVLFMGGVIPIYGSERGYVGTVLYVTSPSRGRINEAQLGAWEMGARVRPLFLGFTDIAVSVRTEYVNRFLPEVVTRALVRAFRTYRPLVVFTHDVNGEYGHWQHKIVSAAVQDAVRLSADPTYDPDSATEYGTWTVQKLYVHLYETDPLVLDVNTPLDSRDGRTALEIAKTAFLMHASQQNGHHHVQSDTDRYALSRFGMAYGTVPAGADAFDNIDPVLLASYVPPSPTPEPTATPAPTATPTAAPTAVPTAAPTEAPAEPQPPAGLSPAWLAAAAALGSALTAACFLFLRKRKNA